MHETTQFTGHPHAAFVEGPPCPPHVRPHGRLPRAEPRRRINGQRRAPGEVREWLRRCCFAATTEHPGDSIDAMLQALADRLPIGWQYPEVCCARISMAGMQYATANFQTSPWRQVEDIEAAGEKVGTVEIGYLQEKPEGDEGPFLAEERALIQLVAESLGRIVERFRAHRQLRETMAARDEDRAALQQANAALRAVWSRIEEEKKGITEAIHANVERILMPILHGLEEDSPPHLRQRVALVKQGLGEIVSPFVNRLVKTYAQLTPVEIAIANLIKGGLGTKEIAHLRHISPATVARHREHIRKKLGLTNRKANLTSYLQTCEGESAG